MFLVIFDVCNVFYFILFFFGFCFFGFDFFCFGLRVLILFFWGGEGWVLMNLNSLIFPHLLGEGC